MYVLQVEYGADKPQQVVASLAEMMPLAEVKVRAAGLSVIWNLSAELRAFA